MISVFLKRWDWLFLKPVFLMFIVASIKFFFEGRWGLGIYLLVASIWGVGGIGQGLYLHLSAKELATGGMSRVSDDDLEPTGIAYQNLTSSLLKLAMLVFVTVTIIGLSISFGVLKSLGVAVISSAIILAGSMLYVVLSRVVRK